MPSRFLFTHLPAMFQGFRSLLSCLLLVVAASAQLSGSVGPTTPLSDKQATICNVLDYGGTVGSDDIGPAIASAFTVSSFDRGSYGKIDMASFRTACSRIRALRCMFLQVCPYAPCRCIFVCS